MLSAAGKFIGGSKGSPPPPPETDPLWNSTVLCMNMESTAFPDARGHAVTVSNVGLYNGTAADFNGTVSSFLSVSDSADFTYGTGDVCFEADFIMDSVPDGGAWGLMGQWPSTFLFYVTPTGVTFYINGSVAIVSASVTWAIGTRYHLAMQRDVNSWKLYVNGTLMNTGASAAGYNLNDGAQNIIIGKNGDNDRNFVDGKVFGARITKAVRYTTNFTPPTTFPTTGP